ncbi:gamma-glutamylcyclotransferase family protein [Nocardia suismassiliense]|uniref:gamma-glutamylcyclotransferase family protein n=1 Tax=Nocardia suismassiliense TaxID=2077092 RepID=UPI000D1E4A77|nr:gamma-glutamylcyclotransferase family protein [Nocardia suismassiliense]
MDSLPPNARRLAQHAGQRHALFVYGTLQFPEVLEVLIGRVPPLQPATAPGWRVATLTDRLYPGLVPAPNALAHGTVLSGLTPAEWQILDAFEDTEYDLRTIQLTDSTDPAWTYIWTSAVTQEDWHPQTFATTHLTQFAAHCLEWRRQL